MTEKRPDGLTVPGPLAWQHATVERIVDETHRVKTFSLSLESWRPFKPGQHVRLRLTAADGYQAQRSYSIASPPEEMGRLDITVELVPDGEVSPFLHEGVVVGDRLELRGPIGGPFTWTHELGGPLLLVAGGSGIVPLMSMLRHRKCAGGESAVALLYSSRSLEDVIYRQELDAMASVDRATHVVHTLTRRQPPGWNGHARRVDRRMLSETLELLGSEPHAFVCGPTAFVESVSDRLLALGVSAEMIRTERFGPSG